MDDEEVWKCPRHPSRRRRTGVCHVCLRERLSSLCPDCANARPCPCYSNSSPSATPSSSASSSSSFSRFSAAGSVRRVSSLIESEPPFRRSRSVAVPVSKPNRDRVKTTSSSSLWSLFKNDVSGSKSKRVGAEGSTEVPEKSISAINSEEERRKMMMKKSRSVAAMPGTGVGDARSRENGNKKSKGKGHGWHFPSPMKVFKQSISRGLMVPLRSPLHRG